MMYRGRFKVALYFPLFLLLSSLTIGVVYAQLIDWEHTWGIDAEDYSTGIAVTSHYVYLSGRGLNSLGYPVATLMKFDEDGNLIWDRIWSYGVESEAADVAVDQKGDVYLVGRGKTSAKTYYAFIAKFDSSGDLLWDRIIEDALGSAVAVDNLGNVYLVGYPTASVDVFIAKFDSSGSLLWARSWGTAGGYEYPGDAVIDSAGNIYVTGWTNGFGLGDYHAFVTKFDPSGNPLWTIIWQAGTRDYGRGLAIKGEYIYAAFKTYTNDYAAVVAKFDRYGNLIWDRSWDGSADDRCEGITVGSSDMVFLTGWTKSFGAGGEDVFIAAFTLSGKLLWDMVWGGTDDDEARAIAADATSIYVTGSTRTSNHYSSDPNAVVADPVASITSLSTTTTYLTISALDPNAVSSDPDATLDDVSGIDAFILRIRLQAPVGGEVLSSPRRIYDDIFGVLMSVIIIFLLTLAAIKCLTKESQRNLPKPTSRASIL